MKLRFWMFLVCYLTWTTIVWGQLYYFVNADSYLVGVRNVAGDTIIPALFRTYGNIPSTDSIADPTIEFYFSQTAVKYDEQKPATPMGAVYDRVGKFLYYPQMFDNGPDYWEEGIRRYVDGDKMGFVDRLGNKITPALWEFVAPFNYGYAVVTAGQLKKKYLDGGEHWVVAAMNEGDSISSYLIDRQGKKVTPLTKQEHEKDYLYEGRYYPYPFRYPDEEQAMVDSINRIDALSLIHGLPYVPYDPDRQLQFELVECPNSYFPYYVLVGYDEQRLNGDFEIMVHQDTKEVYVSRWSYRNEFVPLRAWILDELGQELQREGLDDSVKRRIQKEISEWSDL